MNKLYITLEPIQSGRVVSPRAVPNQANRVVRIASFHRHRPGWRTMHPGGQKKCARRLQSCPPLPFPLSKSKSS